jgi:hypothetical protein
MVQWPSSDLTPLVKNPTTLYRLLTNLTCEKGGRYGKDVLDPALPGSDLRSLLHETAAAMTVFGRDNIPFDELDYRLSLMNCDLLKRVQETTKENPVTSLMINFFFKGGRTELGAEFLHKSFREFLFAEAIIESLKNFAHSNTEPLPERSSQYYWEDFQRSDPRYTLSRRLATLLAPQWITREVALFIEGLIRWELARSYGMDKEPTLGTATQALSIQQWCIIRDTLADLWDWWGEGIHLRLQPFITGKKIDSWNPPYVADLIKWAMPQDVAKGEVPVAPRATSMDGHLGDGLFRLTTLVHHFIATVPDQNPNWQKVLKTVDEKVKAVRRYQSVSISGKKHVIRFRPSGKNSLYFQNYSARINAVGWHPGTIFPSGINMDSIDLDNTTLISTAFLNTSLKGATFRCVNFISIYFGLSDLCYADFSGAVGQNIFIDGCKLDHVLFKDSYMIYVNFVRTTPKKKIVDEMSKRSKYISIKK